MPTDPAIICPECGAQLPAGTPATQCPNCLLGLGLPGAPPERDPEAASGNQKSELRSPKRRGHGRREAQDAPLATDLGDYELLEEVGRGGMGVVYRARQKSLDRIVALKMLMFGPRATPESVKRFRAEAVATAALQHPNIVAIHEVGFCAGQHFLVMDLVEGGSLARVISEFKFELSDFKRAARYVKTIAEAVHYAHERGILHRDLKPSNILIDAQDQPWVTDFGLARRLESDSELTVTGQVLGSPNYMPPEQASGKRGRVGRRSDVYALGAVLYHTLTGRPPLAGDGLAEIVQQVLTVEPVPPRVLSPRLPVDLETVCLKCLEKEPDRRYPTAQVLAEELGRFLNGQPVLARPIGAAGKAWRWCRRQPVRAGLIAAVILVSALGLSGVLWEWRAAQRSADAEAQQRWRADEQARVAKTSALLARKNAYAADMKEVQRKLEENNLGSALDVLNRHRPEANAQRRMQNAEPEVDLRGWEWRYLWARCQSEEISTLCQCSHAVTALAFSSDGKWLAVRCDDGHILLWDAVARKQGLEMPGAGWHKALAFAPQGNLLAWGNADCSGEPVVSIRDVSTTNTARDIRLSAELVSVAFSPDARQMATLAYDGRVGIWDVKTRQSLTNFLIAPVDVWKTIFKHEGAGLPGDEPVTPGDARRSPVRLRPARAKVYTDHYGRVLFSPDGHWLAVGKAEPGIYLLECATGRSRELTVPAVAHGITTLAFSPDSKLLAAAYGAGDADVHLWDLESGGAVAQLSGHSGWIADLAFSPDGQTLASVSADQTLRLWNVASRIERRGPFRGNFDEVWAVAWSKDGTELVTGGKDGSVRGWDPAAQALGPYTVVPSQVQPWGGLDFLPDGQTFLTASPPEGAIVRWDTAKVQRLETLSFLGTNHICLGVSRDGRWLALADGSENIQVWDFPRREIVTNLFFRDTKVQGVLFFPRGGFLNCGGYDASNRQVTKFWSVGDWREVDLPGPALQGAIEPAFSPSEPRVAIGYFNGKAAWWDLVTGQRQGPPFDCDSEGFVHVAFSPDGKWFATGSRNGKITLWDVATREAKPIGRGHRNELSHLAFSADGQRLAGTGSDPKGPIKFWDVETGRDVATLPGEPDCWFCQTGFSPDGNTLFAVSVEARALLWRAPSWKEIESAEKKRKAP